MGNPSAVSFNSLSWYGIILYENGFKDVFPMNRRKVLFSVLALIVVIAVAVTIIWPYVRDTASPSAAPAADVGATSPIFEAY